MSCILQTNQTAFSGEFQCRSLALRSSSTNRYPRRLSASVCTGPFPLGNGSESQRCSTTKQSRRADALRDSSTPCRGNSIFQKSLRDLPNLLRGSGAAAQRSSLFAELRGGHLCISRHLQAFSRCMQQNQYAVELLFACDFAGSHPHIYVGGQARSARSP